MLMSSNNFCVSSDSSLKYIGRFCPLLCGMENVPAPIKGSTGRVQNVAPGLHWAHWADHNGLLLHWAEAHPSFLHHFKDSSYAVRVLVCLVNDKIFGNGSKCSRPPPKKGFLIFTFKSQNKTVWHFKLLNSGEHPGEGASRTFFPISISSSAPCSDPQLSRTEADNIQQKRSVLPLQGICSTAAFLRAACRSEEAGRAGSKRCLLSWVTHGTVVNVGSDS